MSNTTSNTTPAGTEYVRHMDAVECLRQMPKSSVDLVLTDPAYHSLEKHRKRGTTTRLTRQWFPIFSDDRFPEFFAEAYRVLRPNRHLYVICDVTTMFVIKPMGEAAGFTFWKPVIWDKVCIGMGYHYRARYEVILFFEKGKRKLNDLGVPDVLTFKRVYRGYPTEKPVGLLRTLIEQSTAPGELVVDPFAGSGSTGEAALTLDRHFVGADIQASSAQLANARLASVAAN